MAEIDEVIVRRRLNGPVKELSVSFRPVIFKNFDYDLDLQTNEERLPNRFNPITTYQGTYRKVVCNFLYPVGKDLDHIETLIDFFYPETAVEIPSDGTAAVENVVSNPMGDSFIFEFGKFTAKPISGTPKSFKYSYVNSNTLGNVPKLINGVVIPRYIDISFDITVLTGAGQSTGAALQQNGIVGIRNGRIVGTFLK